MTPMIAQLDALPAVRCPCGFARRAFGGQAEDVALAGAGTAGPATVHLVEILEDSRVHYHRKQTEIYVVLEGSGRIELDGAVHPIVPLTAILIPPGCRHRAAGRLKLLNLVIPAFDPADEWFD